MVYHSVRDNYRVIMRERRTRIANTSLHYGFTIS